MEQPHSDVDSDVPGWRGTKEEVGEPETTSQERGHPVGVVALVSVVLNCPQSQTGGPEVECGT